MLKTDFELQIRESYAIVREHEAIIQTSNRPEEKLHSRRQIEEQKKLTKETLAKYLSLCKQLKEEVPQDIVEIAIVLGYSRDALNSPTIQDATSSPAPLDKPMSHTTPSLFLSYARADLQHVEKIYQMLIVQGYKPWMDVHDILGGEDWHRAINIAIDKCELFVPVLSNNSVNRRGMIVKEVRRALDKWNGMLPSDIYVIPLRLDDCPIPELVQHLQVVDWEAGKGKNKLFNAIDVAIKRRN